MIVWSIWSSNYWTTNNRSGEGSRGNSRLQQTQAQVDEVVGIMRTNVEKVLERDQKLSELDDRADALQQGASQFEVHATKLKRKYWWQNMKVCTCCCESFNLILYDSHTSSSPSTDDADFRRCWCCCPDRHNRWVHFFPWSGLFCCVAVQSCAVRDIHVKPLV